MKCARSAGADRGRGEEQRTDGRAGGGGGGAGPPAGNLIEGLAPGRPRARLPVDRDGGVREPAAAEANQRRPCVQQRWSIGDR